MMMTAMKPQVSESTFFDRKPIFKELAISESNARFTRKQVPKNTILFSEGDPATGFYIVEKGSLRSYRSSGIGKQQTFQIYTPGAWLGLRDTVSGETYLHHAIALEDSVVLFVEEAELNRLLICDSEFQKTIFRQVVKDSIEAENKIYSLGTRQVHAKLAEFLLQSRKFQTGDVDLPFTREVMASIIGVTTETLVRALTDLKNRGWIDIDKRKAFIKDELALRKLLD